MLRSMFAGSLVVFALAGSALAQGYVNGPRMATEEASLIADYWVRSYLRRAPGPDEHQYWTNQLLSTSPARVLSALLAGEEYYNYAGGTPHGLMRQLIADVGHRQASPYEVEGRLRRMGGLSPQALAYEFLREHPRNWWPGPAATPPRELQYFYRGAYRGNGQRYW
jgi:hypothetical protein